MDITSVNGKRGHGFGKEQGGLGGRNWREERKRGNYIIMPKISKIKFFKYILTVRLMTDYLSIIESADSRLTCLVMLAHIH